MEVISYVPPVSWDDKGMIWDDNINPITLDYAIAIRDAIMERYNSIGIHYYRDFSGWHLWTVGMCFPMCYDFFIDVQDCLRDLAPYFVNLEYQSTSEDFSDLPKYWSYRDLNMIDDCRICEMPSRGSLLTEIIPWMIRAKNFINKLLICKTKMKYAMVGGDASSNLRTIDNATEAKRIALQRYNDAKNAQTTYNYNRHDAPFYSYEMAVSYYHLGLYGDDIRASIRAPLFSNLPRENSPEREFKYCVVLVTNTVTDKTIGLVPYVEKSVWDDCGLEINRGVTIREFSRDDGIDIAPRDIPTNTMEPSHTVHYATVIGMSGTAYFFKNYGVDGGFKFRP